MTSIVGCSFLFGQVSCGFSYHRLEFPQILHALVSQVELKLRFRRCGQKPLAGGRYRLYKSFTLGYPLLSSFIALRLRAKSQNHWRAQVLWWICHMISFTPPQGSLWGGEARGSARPP